MGPLAGTACVAVLALLLFALSLIKPPANLLRCRGFGVGGRVGGGVCWPGRWIRGERAVWVMRAVCCHVIVLQTEVASGNGACPACKGFVV